MILGLRTALFHVAPSDLGKIKEWYTTVLGVGPYFDQPFYVGFNLGGFEFGLVPEEKILVKEGSLHVYWGVENIEEAVDRFTSNQATLAEGIQDVGEGIKVASVVDPFGNRFGLIQNPLFGK